MLATKEVFSEIETLPREYLPEVLDFVVFLKTKSEGKTDISKTPLGKNTQSLYGMFADTGDTLDKFLARKQAEKQLEYENG